MADMSEMFAEKTQGLLQRLGLGSVMDNAPQDPDAFENYDIIEWYCRQKDLVNTYLTLPIIAHVYRTGEGLQKGKQSLENMRDLYYLSRMLIDLRIPLSPEEEDILLSSSLLRVLDPHYLDYAPFFVHLDKKAVETAKVMIHPGTLSDDKVGDFFKNIRENKLALLVLFAERGTLMNRLYEASGWNARRYINETRAYYFPLSIYAKEHYRDVLPTVHTLTEKMRCLIDVSEILLTRYENIENELVSKILELQEDNAEIRGAIKRQEELRKMQ